jgi:hypothetical protein
VLNLDDLVAEVEAAFEGLLKRPRDRRRAEGARAAAASGLLAPVELAPGRSASVSSSETTVVFRVNPTGAIAASATGPASDIFFADEKRC